VSGRPDAPDAGPTLPVLHTLPALRVEAGIARRVDEELAEETAIALVYNGAPHAVMMATPADLHDFAVGFSVGEGIVAAASDVAVVDVLVVDAGVSVQMCIPQAAFDALDERARTLSGRTGCGLCGTASLSAAIRPVRRVPPRPAPDGWLQGFAALQARQPLNARTGAVHAAAVLDAGGRLYVREDVGRHVAIDKAIGAACRAGVSPRALLVTSRASYEVVHKAAQAGIGHVAAISAPTAFAVRLAAEAGVQLVGFARDGRHTVYAGPGFDSAGADP
jgi:formate dehydrogenase accessory protein FdhD